MAGVYAGVDKLELEKIRARTHRGLRERAATGFFAGGKTFGYKSAPVDPNDERTKHKLVIVPEEAAVIREAFAMYADGMSPKRIANLLNERGVPSPGSRWKRTQRRAAGWMSSVFTGTASRDSGMFRCELYCGRMIWNRRKAKKRPGTSKRCVEMRPQSEWTVSEVPELRIIEQELWARVQHRLMTNRERATEQMTAKRGKPHVSRYLLSGLLQCGSCNSNFIMANALAYRCSSHTHGGQHCCSNNLMVRRDVIEPIVLRGIRRDLLSDEALAELHRYAGEQQRAKHSHRSITQREVREVEAAIDRVTPIAEAGLSRALKEKLASLEKRRDELERSVRLLGAEPVELVPRLGERWRAMVDELEHLAKRPDARPLDVEEARERLANRLSSRPARRSSIRRRPSFNYSPSLCHVPSRDGRCEDGKDPERYQSKPCSLQGEGRQADLLSRLERSGSPGAQYHRLLQCCGTSNGCPRDRHIHATVHGPRHAALRWRARTKHLWSERFVRAPRFAQQHRPRAPTVGGEENTPLLDHRNEVRGGRSQEGREDDPALVSISPSGRVDGHRQY